ATLRAYSRDGRTRYDRTARPTVFLSSRSRVAYQSSRKAPSHARPWRNRGSWPRTLRKELSYRRSSSQCPSVRKRASGRVARPQAGRRVDLIVVLSFVFLNGRRHSRGFRTSAVL